MSTSSFSISRFNDKDNGSNSNEKTSRKRSACEMKQKIEGEKEEKDQKISRKSVCNLSDFILSTKHSSFVHSALNESGNPLDKQTKDYMEPRFGFDFRNVRIHNSSETTSKSAESINALAYTVGNDIVFKNGQYIPNTLGGNKLLAHELTHVIQQNGSVYNAKINTQGSTTFPNTNKSFDANAKIYRYTHQDCTETDLKSHIWTADSIASKMATRSVNSLYNFKRNPSDPHIRDLLLKNFNDDSVSTINKVLSKFIKISNEFAGDDYQYECEDDCDSENAYVYGFWTDIHLCMNKLSGKSNNFIAGVIVHEMSHYAAGTDDNEYFYPGTGQTTLSVADAVDNADSYRGVCSTSVIESHIFITFHDYW